MHIIYKFYQQSTFIYLNTAQIIFFKWDKGTFKPIFDHARKSTYHPEILLVYPPAILDHHWNILHTYYNFPKTYRFKNMNNFMTPPDLENNVWMMTCDKIPPFISKGDIYK